MNTYTSLRKREGRRGQALVEFSLAIIVFLTMLMGIFDLGRAIFIYNGVSEAARDIARRAAVYPFQGTANATNLGSSDQVRATINTHLNMIPGMHDLTEGAPDFECVDIEGNPSTSSYCSHGSFADYVRVTVSADYKPITPLVGLFGQITISSSSTASFPKWDQS
jgi:Flp pilus assembly protein TadG